MVLKYLTLKNHSMKVHIIATIANKENISTLLTKIALSADLFASTCRPKIDK